MTGPRTDAGKWVVAHTVWQEGMRGHFSRLGATTFPGHMEWFVECIEDEAVEGERARIVVGIWRVLNDCRENMSPDAFTQAESLLDAMLLLVAKDEHDSSLPSTPMIS